MARVTLSGLVTTVTSFRSIEKKRKFVRVDLQYVFNILIVETTVEKQFN